MACSSQGVLADDMVVGVLEPDICFMEFANGEAVDNHAAHMFQQEARQQRMVHTVKDDRAKLGTGPDLQIVLGRAGDGHDFVIPSGTNEDFVPRRCRIHRALDRRERGLGTALPVV